MQMLRVGVILSLLFFQHNGDPVSVKETIKDRKYYEERGEIVWEIQTDQKVIGLSFDDGPCPTQTPEILDLLKEYGAKATFFTIGQQLERFPDLARRELMEGHELANHTYSHRYFNAKTPIEVIESEIKQAQDIQEKQLGTTPRLFRPPGGYYNDRVVKAAKDEGYRLILWSWTQDTKDWRKPGVNKIVNKVLNNVKGGDIILFHDRVEGRSQTADALRRILPELKKQGYSFVTISDLLHYKTNGKEAVP